MLQPRPLFPLLQLAHPSPSPFVHCVCVWLTRVCACGSSSTTHSILAGGVIWSDHGGASQDLTIVSTRGIDMFKVAPRRNQLSFVRAYKHPTTAFHYDPISRALLLADTATSTLRCFFLTKSLADTKAPRLELPPPKRTAKFTLKNPTAASFKLVNLYDEVYVVDINPDYQVRLRRSGVEGRAGGGVGGGRVSSEREGERGQREKTAGAASRA